MKSASRQPLILLCSYAVFALLNLLAIYSARFANWYAATVFPVLSGIGCRLTGWIPAPLGILLAIAGILLLLIGTPVVLVLHHKKQEQRKKIRRVTVLVFAWMLLYVFATETLHCFIMYRQTPLGEQQFSTTTASTEELLSTYRQMLQKLETLEPQITRTGMGYVKYTGTEAELDDTVRDAMRGLGSEDARFSGYYPSIKRFVFPAFFDYAGTTGLYLPYTLEASIAPDLSYNETAFTACHELAHLKGVILEDEANYIAFRACIGSDDPFMQYSGYVAMMRYFDNAIIGHYDALKNTNPEAAEEWITYYLYMPERNTDGFGHVRRDAWNYYRYDADTPDEFDAEQEAYNNTVLPEEAVSAIGEVSETLTDTSLKINGVSDGTQSYGRVVDLAIQYLLANQPV